MEYAGADALSTVSLSSTTTALLLRTESTVATPAGTTGSSVVTDTWCCWRSLTCQASTAPPATTAPITAARNSCVVGSTGESYEGIQREFSAEARASERSPLVHVTTPAGHLSCLGSVSCEKPSTNSSTVS